MSDYKYLGTMVIRKDSDPIAQCANCKRFFLMFKEYARYGCPGCGCGVRSDARNIFSNRWYVIYRVIKDSFMGKVKPYGNKERYDITI